jgi:speckle-type POZ protein
MIRVDGYSLKMGMGIGNFVRLETFKVGGLDWSIRFYPDGTHEILKEYVGICLELMSSNTEARVH